MIKGTMQVKTIAIPGKPMGKQRARMSFTTKRTYTPDETVRYENLIKMTYAEKYQNNQPYKDPIGITVMAYMPMPQSWSKKKQMEVVGFPCLTKPDTDNILKIAMDSLNGIAYIDDKQIYKASIYKAYSTEPRLEIILTLE
jgi:Holliday junction resolvase RusA-like endonuclease